MFVMQCNSQGETEGYDALAHIEAICEVIGEGIIDEVIVDTVEIPEEILSRYKKQRSDRVLVNKESIKKKGIKVKDRDILEIDSKGMVRHHPYKLAATLYSLIDKWEEFYV